MQQYLIYKCRNCGQEKKVHMPMAHMEGAHVALRINYSHAPIKGHRCSDVRVGVADLIAIEEGV